MVRRSYMLEKPPGPAAVTRFLHWTAFPAAINGAGAAEGALARLAAMVRRAPFPVLGVAMAVGAGLAYRPARRRTVRRRQGWLPGRL